MSFAVLRAAEGSEYEPTEEVEKSKNHDRESWQGEGFHIAESPCVDFSNATRCRRPVKRRSR